MGRVWLTGYAFAAARGRRLLTRPRVRRTVEQVSGVTLIALGASLAFDSK
jgi:threonine/homoserine/homoserine lactone efflux protein